MNEANIHFKINEYLIRFETKNDQIKELKTELDNLEIKNKELHQTKNKLIEEYKKNEKNNNKIINSYNLTNKNNINNPEFSCKINKNNQIKKKRNNSATISKRRIDMDIIKEIKTKNEELNNKLILLQRELNDIKTKVNEKEINCKLLIFNAKNIANFYSKK